LKANELLITVLVVLLSFAVSAGFVLLGGFNPATVYSGIVYGSLGTPFGILRTLVILSLIVLTGLSALVPFRAGVWNIGAEGQLYIGAMVATSVALLTGNWELPLIAGTLAGASWGGIAGLLKARFGADEIILTIMLNYIAISLVSYSIGPVGPLRDPSLGGFQSRPIPYGSHLPVILDPLSVGIIISAASVVVVHFMLGKTTLGYSIRALGANRTAAIYAGVNQRRVILTTMLVGGGLAGLAGAILICGTTFLLVLGVSSNYGYVGIATATLGGLNPVGNLLAASFFSFLYTGGEATQVSTQVPLSLANTITGSVIVLVLLKTRIINRVESFRKRTAEEETMSVSEEPA